jgi:NADH dehydrogenase
VRITLIDRRNHHLFQPLLYQVATAGLSPRDIASPIRRILRRQENVLVLMAEATRIDPAEKKVHLADGELSFDYLVVATGVTHSWFGNEEWARHAPGLKTIEDALEIRKRIFLAYEAAEREPDPETRREWMTFVVVGGGPTGVELAGALGEISRFALSNDFRRIDPAQAKILLLEGGERILSQFDRRLSEKAAGQLAALGVEIRTGSYVSGIDGEGVVLGGDKIRARTVLWSAGVAGTPLAATLDVPLDREGRVRVEPDLALPGHPDIFVIGDLAATEPALPGVAPVAMQGGKHVARVIRGRLRGEVSGEFRYRDKGMMATIGRSAAIAHVGSMKLSGFPAWLMWLGIHIIFLIGFRNRFGVLFEWAWAWVTYERGARLITGERAPVSASESDPDS